jgi:hypothetical protein
VCKKCKKHPGTLTGTINKKGETDWYCPKHRPGTPNPFKHGVLVGFALGYAFYILLNSLLTLLL